MNLLNLLSFLDREATLALNSLHVPLTDAVWMLFSDKKVWFPLYLILIVLLFLRMNWKKALIVLVSAVLAVVACDQLANLVKDAVCRLRPCWDSRMLSGGLRVLEGKGSLYGFFSAHAANAFALATSLGTGFMSGDKSRSYKGLSAAMYVWATLVGLSRIFVGKHFLGDVLAGAAVGLLAGWLFGRLARWAIEKYSLYL